MQARQEENARESGQNTSRFLNLGPHQVSISLKLVRLLAHQVVHNPLPHEEHARESGARPRACRFSHIGRGMNSRVTLSRRPDLGAGAGAATKPCPGNVTFHKLCRPSPGPAMAASKAARLSALLLALAIGIIGAACSSHHTVELTSWTDQLPELSEFDTVLSQENVLSETELSRHLPQLDFATLPGAYGGHHKRWYHHPHHHGAPAPSPAHHWQHKKAHAPSPAHHWHHHKAPAPKPAHHHKAPAPKPAHHWHHHKAPAPKPVHHHKAPAPKPAHHHHNGPAPAPHHHGHHHHPYPHAHPPHPPHPKPQHPHPHPHHKTVTGKGLENGAKVADPTTWYGRGR